MPIAAVPRYLVSQLAKDFSETSPAQRFGIFLPIWTERKDQEEEVKNRAEAKSPEGKEFDTLLRQRGMDGAICQLEQRFKSPLPKLWQKNDAGAKLAWKKSTKLTQADKERMEAWAQRQDHIAQTIPAPQLLTLDAIATAPFTTGLGNEHPLENGFSFLNPYGLPYLPGSSIKGVLRQAARELASGEWGQYPDWPQEKIHQLSFDNGKKPIGLSCIEVLFGLESGDGGSDHVRGALTFWDTMPNIKGGSLQAEIMTPHQGHYYQQNATPHDSGQPIPISFLTVPPESGFTFYVQCDLPRLQWLAPDLAENERWKKLLQSAFQHAFEWLGFGAKTSVGYGAMHQDHAALQRRQQAQKEQEKKERITNLSPAMQAIETFVAEFQADLAKYPNRKKDKPNGIFHTKARTLATTTHEHADWNAEEKRMAAEAIEEWLPKLVQIDIKDERKKLKLAALKGL